MQSFHTRQRKPSKLHQNQSILYHSNVSFFFQCFFYLYGMNITICTWQRRRLKWQRSITTNLQSISELSITKLKGVILCKKKKMLRWNLLKSSFRYRIQMSAFINVSIDEWNLWKVVTQLTKWWENLATNTTPEKPKKTNEIIQ